MKKISGFLSLVLTIILVAGLCVPAFAATEDTGFSDVAATAWYADSVKYVRDNGLMNGTSATTFSPEADTSRAMLTTILYRASGSPAVTNTTHFSDVSPDAYYANAVAWASENNIVSGYGNGRFGANDPVTREQIAAILWRYVGSPNVGTAQDFVDESQISAYAMDAVDWARTNGVINGMNGNRFAPKNHAPRAQVATILRNYMTMNQHQPEQPTEGAGSKALVAYFSRAGENYNVGVVEKGNTAVVAEMIAEQTGADLFEIRPVTPYPSDYNEMLAVSRRETQENARPEISNTVDDWDSYDVVFLGYPIWGGDMPKIVYHFLESYDFSGKTIVPFCTHAGSGLANTVSTIRSECSGAAVLDGFAIEGRTAQNNRDETERMVAEWLKNTSRVVSSLETSSASDLEQAAMETYREQARAMVEQDIQTLERTMDDALILRHMSGVTQTKSEWLKDIEDEEMRYYSIDIQNLSAEVQDDVVVVHHTSVIDARIYGSRGTWTLTGDSYYANRNGHWVRVNKPAE